MHLSFHPLLSIMFIAHQWFHHCCNIIHWFHQSIYCFNADSHWSCHARFSWFISVTSSMPVFHSLDVLVKSISHLKVSPWALHDVQIPNDYEILTHCNFSYYHHIQFNHQCIYHFIHCCQSCSSPINDSIPSPLPCMTLTAGPSIKSIIYTLILIMSIDQ